MFEQARPHNKKEAQASDDVANKESRNPEVTSNQILVRAYLDSIDEEALRKTFEKFGVDTQSELDIQKFISLQDIILIDDKTGMFVGLHNDQTITLNAAFIESKPLDALHAVIHEELHAVSSDDITIDAAGVLTSLKSGVTHYTKIDATYKRGESTFISKPFEVANEGITEWITEEIMAEYLSHTGDTDMYSTSGMAGILDFLDTRLYTHEYGPYHNAVHMYSVIISTLTHTPLETIKQQIIQTYLHRGDIMSPEIITMLRARTPILVGKVEALLNTKQSAENWEDIIEDILTLRELTPSEKKTINNEAALVVQRHAQFLQTNPMNHAGE
jgi:hypothetical protein